MVALSKRNAAKEGVADKAQFIQADLFETDFSQATVITMFLLPEINLKLRPKILNLKPGTRIVSNTFDMGEWQADQTASVEEGETCKTYCTALSLDRAGKSRRHMEASARRPHAQAKLSDDFRHAQIRCHDRADHEWATERRSTQLHCRQCPLHRPGERQHHAGDVQIQQKHHHLEHNPNRRHRADST